MAVFRFLVEGGKASAGPPIGSTLGPMGVNIGQVVAEINKATAKFQGMQVPVTVIIDDVTKEVKVEVGTPPTSALIKKAIGIEKGSSKPGEETAGDVSLEKIVEIGKEKMKDMKAPTLKSAVKQVLGTCVSMGVTVDGKDPREIQKAIDAGEIDF